MHQRKRIYLLVLLVLAVMCASCGRKLEGTYSDVNGGIVLELKPGHKATLSFMGDARECSYKVDGGRLSLNCQGEETVFTIHDDGSLTGPPGSFMGALRKARPRP